MRYLPETEVKSVTRVSGVLPIRNGENWLPQKIHEIMNNLEEVDELITIDDNSCDRTYQLLKNLSSLYPNLIVIKNRERGIISALNLGISLAVNEIIFRYDIDDAYSPDRRVLQLNEIKKGSALVFGDYAIWGDGVKRLGIIPTAISNNATKLSLLRARRNPHPLACFSKNLFDDVGGYLAADAPAEDHGLWIRMSKNAVLSTVPSVLLDYNLNSKSTSFTNYHQIKQKTFELNLSWKLGQDDLESLVNSIENYSALSALMPFGEQRFVLHLYDLLHPQFFKQLSTTNQKFVKSYLQSNIIRINNLNSIACIALDVVKRKIYRRLNRL